MPWHCQSGAKKDYQKRTTEVCGEEFEIDSRNEEICLEEESAEVSNMSVAKFRNILQNNEKKGSLGLFQVLQCGNFETKDSNIELSKGMQKLIEKYGDVFRSDLPSGLPPMREVGHEIIVEEDAKPPHRSLYQLSPAELKAAKEYIVELLKNGKIRPSKSPSGAPLFFVKDGENPLRGVVDYRALNRNEEV